MNQMQTKNADTYSFLQKKLTKMSYQKFHNLKRSHSWSILSDKTEVLLRSKSFEDVFVKKAHSSQVIDCQQFLSNAIDEPKVHNRRTDACGNDLNELISDPIKKDLINKAIELGFTIEKIWNCFKKTSENSQTIDEEKFFENLINLSTKSECVSSEKNVSLDKNLDGLISNNDQYDNIIENIHEFNSEEIKSKQRLEEKMSKEKKTTKISKPSSDNGQKLEYEKNTIQLIQREIETPVKYEKSNLRPIIVDGIDVSQSQIKQVSSASRIKLVVDFFDDRGHRVDVIVPGNFKEIFKGKERDYLIELEVKGKLYSPPFRKLMGGKRIECECDLFMLGIAERNQGIIVSNNDFKKVLNEGDKYKLIIEERLLLYSFVHDEFIPAPDPLGKSGPNLDNFLLFETVINQKICPYGKKCTYGTKCKFKHPERLSKKQFKTAHQSVIDEAQENKKQLELFNQKGKKSDEIKNFDFRTRFENKKDELVERGIKSIKSDSGSNLQNNKLLSKFPKKENVTMVQSLIDFNADSHFRTKNAYFSTTSQENEIIYHNNNIKKPDESRITGFNKALFEKLCTRLSESKAFEVINAYPNETDVEKLVFFAEDKDFFD